jgi:hypothetical protein
MLGEISDSYNEGQRPISNSGDFNPTLPVPENSFGIFAMHSRTLREPLTREEFFALVHGPIAALQPALKKDLDDYRATFQK